MKRLHRMYAPTNAQFAVYLSFYTPCARAYIDDTDVVHPPLRLFNGTADDIAPLARHVSHVGRLQAAGNDVQLTEYAGRPWDAIGTELPTCPHLPAVDRSEITPIRPKRGGREALEVRP